MNKIITRFAPSPTGNLHLGNIRTAIFNWLHSKSNNGKVILRIDDTDTKRNKDHLCKNLINDLKWLNIDWDLGPIFQSQRTYLYREIANKMLKENFAYKCYCNKSRLNEIKENQIKQKVAPKYDKHCLMIDKNIKNKNFTIRFNINKIDKSLFNDIVKGLIKISNKELDDFIIIREDGSPTYNFASVIDDIDMKITDIIRGEDHVFNTFKQINLFEALGYNIPKFAHIPMVLDENKKPLSKRDNSNQLNFYKENGFMPEAMINYLIKLGWSYKNIEFFNLKELINVFNVKDIGKSPSIFDLKKLIWMNKYYMKNSNINEIKKHVDYIIKNNPFKEEIYKNIENIIKLQKSRVNNIKEMIEKSDFFYKDNIIDKEKININKKTITLFLKEIIKIEKTWTKENIKKVTENITNKEKIDLKDFADSLRIIITGKNDKNPIFEILSYLGYGKTIKKIKYFIENV